MTAGGSISVEEQARQFVAANPGKPIKAIKQLRAKVAGLDLERAKALVDAAIVELDGASPVPTDMKSTLKMLSVNTFSMGSPIRTLERVLDPDEHVLAADHARLADDHDYSVLIVVTARRVVVAGTRIGKMLGGNYLQDLPHDRIVAVSSGRKLMGTLEIHASGDATIKLDRCVMSEQVADVIRAHIGSSGVQDSSGEATGTGLVSELSRLAELKQSGLLSDAEYTTAKNKLLTEN